MFAIIESGGKQYKVAEGENLRVELLQADPESSVEIDKVLAIFDGDNMQVGTPYVEGATVSCKVVEHGKARKIMVFHYKAKKNIRKKNGHRQPFTKLFVEKINLA